MDKWTIALKVLVIGLLLIVGGCSTVNGLSRDVRTAAEFGIAASQNGVEKQRLGSIGFAIKEQNRIMLQGRNVQEQLASK